MFQRKDKERPIECIVSQYFLRVMKNHNLYSNFRNKGRRILLTNTDKDNMFSNLRDWKNVTRRCKDSLNDSQFPKMNRYDQVTNLINVLLHNFVERLRLCEMEQIGIYGQEIFDMSCYAAYGDEFLKDMETMNNSMNGMHPNNQYEAMMMAEYAFLKRQGNDIDFESFKNDFMRRHPIERFEEQNHEDADDDNFLEELFDDDY